MTHVIVFLFYKLRFSIFTVAGFGRQAIVKIPLPILGKGPRPSKQVADRKSIIGDGPGPIAILSLRFPVRQGEFGYVGLPARPWVTRKAERPAPGMTSAAGDRVAVLAARRQPMLVPAVAAVAGGEDLGAPGNAAAMGGIARVD